MPSPTLRSSCRIGIIRRGGSSASIKQRSANGLFVCAAMPSSPIPSVLPTKSSARRGTPRPGRTAARNRKISVRPLARPSLTGRGVGHDAVGHQVPRVAVAGRVAGASHREARLLARIATKNYRRHLGQLALLSPLDAWSSRIRSRRRHCRHRLRKDPAQNREAARRRATGQGPHRWHLVGQSSTAWTFLLRPL
jgi:hypothetical protein